MDLDWRLGKPHILRELYWGQGMNRDELAEELDCSVGTIHNRFKEYGIETRPRGNQPDSDISILDDRDWLYEEYIEKDRHSNEIAERVGCSGAVVRKRLHRHNIPTRTRGFRSGEKHPLYKGVTNDLYGPNWYRQREAARERDGYACQRCGVSDDDAYAEYSSRNHVHHIKPRSEFMHDGELDHEAANALSNLITLCHGCHKKWEGLPIDNRGVAA